MKLRIVLLSSVFLNAGLLAAYLFTRQTPSAPPAAPAVVANSPAIITRVAKEIRPTRVTETVLTNDFNWATVESEDYRRYIANLRAIGCPEETVRDIIIADVNKLYGARMAALYPSAKDFKFWKVEDRASRAEDRAREQKRRELQNEKRALIKELLGVDYESEMARWSGRPEEEDWRYGFLSSERQAQVKALQDKFRELERAAFNEGGGNNPEARAKVAALRAQREAELAQLLGQQDFEEYQLRNSWTARNMRDSLAAFQPTEEEFRKVFQLRKAYDDQFASTRDGGDEAVREQRRVAQQQLDEQIKPLLGEERYREYQLTQNEAFRDIYDFTERNNLPRSAAESVYEMRQAAEDARRKVASDATIPPEQRAALLAALAEETRRSVSVTLGDAWKDYQRRGGGWINNLARVDSRGRGGEGNDRFIRR